MKDAPKAVMFDIDDTLVQSWGKPTPSMLERLRDVLERFPMAIISGAGFDRISSDFLASLDESHNVNNLYVFANSAAQGYLWDGGWHEVYNFTLTMEERSKIRAAISAAAIDLSVIRDAKIYGDQIADRETQIAFTVVGLDAPLQYKREWDPDAGKRRKIVEYLRPLLPGFDIFTGGASTIDITKSGINKAYGVRWLAERLVCEPSEMLYVGDALYEGGNDAVVIPTGIQTLITTGPSQTEKIIEDLFTKSS